jgi:outer membrane protein assembly factor BamB
LKKVLLILFSSLFFSCSSVSIKENLQVNEKNDWLTVGGSPAKRNVSPSDSPLNPPFNRIWDFYADGGFAKNSLSASDAILFASTLKGEMYAIDVASGKSLGKITTLGKASFCTPAILNNNVILTFDGDKKKSITSYNIKAGEENWSRFIGMVKSSPVIYKGSIYACSANGRLYKIDAETGSITWQFSERSDNGRLEPFYTSPSIYEDMVIAGSTDGSIYAVDINSGSKLWEYKTPSPVFADISIDNERLYFGGDDMRFYCLDRTGAEIWKTDLKTKFTSSSTFYNDLVITTAINGKVYALDKNTGQVKWELETKGAIWASPVVHNNKVFAVSFDKNIYCLNAEDGALLWKHTMEARLRTTPVIWKDNIFIASDDKRIYCFK